LDHNATTPVDPAVLAVMLPFFSEHFGNPSSVEHAHGHAARQAVEIARQQVATAIGAAAEEIIFTGSCTEADNLAILGAAAAYPDRRHIITCATEHPAVLESCRHLERAGYTLTVMSVDEYGRVDPQQISEAIRADTLLVSVMGGNNEVGTLQPLADIGRVCESRDVLFHADLAQTVAYCATDVRAIGAHLASLSAHKAYGPKGVGALYVRGRRPRVKLKAIAVGGGQERGLRSGTVATPLVAGMGSAFAIVRHSRNADAERLRMQSAALLARISGEVDGVQLNGHPTERLPNNVSLSIEGIEPLALMRLVRDDVSFSASSACATDKIHTSYVLLSMFGDTPRARGAFRLAPGRFTTDDDVERACAALISGIQRLRRLGSH